MLPTYSELDAMKELGGWISIRSHNPLTREVKLENGEIVEVPGALVQARGFLVHTANGNPTRVYFVDKDITHVRKLKMGKVKDLSKFLMENQFKVVMSQKLLMEFPEFKVLIPEDMK